MQSPKENPLCSNRKTMVIHIPYLSISISRHLLHHCFQALMDHGVRVSEILSETFSTQLAVPLTSQELATEKIIQLGFSLGKVQLVYCIMFISAPDKKG